MIKLKIKKQNTLTHQGQFATQAEADAWKADQIANHSWGKPERWLAESEFTTETIQDAIATAQVEVLGQDITIYKFAAEYTIEQEDITAQVARENLKHQIKMQEQACLDVMVEFKADNVALLQTETTPQAVKAAKTLILNKTKKVLDAVKSGDLDLMIEEIKAIPQQDYDSKYITAARLLTYANKARAYKGLDPVQSLSEA